MLYLNHTVFQSPLFREMDHSTIKTTLEKIRDNKNYQPYNYLNAFETHTRRAERNVKLMAHAHSRVHGDKRAEGIARVTKKERRDNPEAFHKSNYKNEY